MSREVSVGEDGGLVDPIEQLLILDSEIDPDRFMFEGVPMERSPEFSIGELCKVFFARTDYWLRWREREDAFLLDGKPVGDRRTGSGARVWNLAEVEQMLHAACRNEVISGVQLYAGLKIARAIAVNYKLLTAAPVKEK